MKLEIPRGMRDIDDSEFAAINFVRDVFIDTCKLFDFRMMEPTTLEMMTTLEAKSGPSVSNETYSFDDKGGRKLALRFDLTVGLTRFVTSRRDLKMPVKIGAFSGVWRYDEPQAGRYRYFHQWDVEIYGPFSNESDAEVIEFVASFFEKLNLDVRIHVNDRQLIEEYIRSKLEVQSDLEVFEMFRAIDKLQKKGPDQVLTEYKEKVDGKKLSLLIELSNERGTPDDLAVRSSELVKLKTWSRVSALMDSLRARGIRNAILDLGIVRGLDYYSGCVFEVFDSSGGAALVGGGRYDSLTEAFGKKDIGATGAAGGVERIVSALNVHGLLKPLVTKIVYVVSATENSMNDIRRIVSNLRKEGIPAAYDVIGRSLKKQLEDAASRGAAICVIAFHDEITQGFVTVRSMSDGKESKHQLKELAEAVRKYL